MEIIALQNYTDMYVSLYEGQVREVEDVLANYLISKNIVIEHTEISSSVQPNWNENDITKSSYILNRPEIYSGSGEKSIIEGRRTSASGICSHAEGQDTIANGAHSHAEGISTTANKLGSHAEGISTTANGVYSHSEGSTTIANGDQSHAEGYGATANGNNSHAEGYETIATGNNSHVEGQFNIEDINNTYAHIIGNGSSGITRSNAYTLDWDGNGWYAGKLTVGSNPSENMDVATKKYVDEAIAQAIAQLQ